MPSDRVPGCGSATAVDRGLAEGCDRREIAFPPPVASARVGNAAKMSGKETEAVVAVDCLIGGWLGAVVT